MRSHTSRAVRLSALALGVVCAMAPLLASAAPADAPPWAAAEQSPDPKSGGAAVLTAVVRPTALDGFEPNDDERAGAVPITVDADEQTRTLETVNPELSGADIDWFSFTAEAGVTYRISARDLGGTRSDPALKYFGNSAWKLMFNDDRRIGDVTAEILWTCTVPGTYVYAVADIWGKHGQYATRVVSEGTVPAGRGHQIGGADRFVVARNIAAMQYPGWTGVANVIIASGLDRAAADPLAASGLAGVLDAPVLLISQDALNKNLPSSTSSAISGIRAANPGTKLKFWIVGGPGSVPTWVRTRLAALAPTSTVERLYGIDRYACSAAVAKRMRELSAVAPTTTLVANGETNAFFYDALAASPVAYSQHYPILLTKKGSLPASTSVEVANYTRRYVIGNDYEVAEGVVTSLAATRVGVTRAPNYSRTFVARAVAEWSIEEGYATRTSFIASNKLADALTGGVLAGSMGAPMLFSASSSTAGGNLEDHVQQSRLDIGDWYVTGGTASITPTLFNRLKFLTSGAPMP